MRTDMSRVDFLSWKSLWLHSLIFGAYEFADITVANGEMEPTCDGGFLKIF